jgi:HK97 family phage prohead protease
MKNITLVCEAKLTVGQQTDESTTPTGKIEARVTTWGAREGADGRKFNYKPEGFASWAAEFAASGKPLPMFLNHNDLGMPVGQWDELTFDDEGMSASGRLFTNTNTGSDLYKVLKESPNMFGGVSVGAYADEACMVDALGNPLKEDDEEGFFQITKGGLREVSVVMYPNNPAAEISQLEYFDADGKADLRTIERCLREAGISKKSATTASSILKRIIEAQNKTPPRSDSDAVVEAAILQALNERILLKELQQRV